jgi:hypothetical protein
LEPSRFDDFARYLTVGHSRRETVAATVLGALALMGLRRGVAAGPGCKDVNKPCKKRKECCSNLCKGKKGKKKCKGHDAGTCKPGSEMATCGGADVACKTFDGQDGLCATTTGNAAFCLIALVELDCTKDADCQKELGPHAACVRCSLAVDGRICATAAPL